MESTKEKFLDMLTQLGFKDIREEMEAAYPKTKAEIVPVLPSPQQQTEWAVDRNNNVLTGNKCSVCDDFYYNSDYWRGTTCRKCITKSEVPMCWSCGVALRVVVDGEDKKICLQCRSKQKVEPKHTGTKEL